MANEELARIQGLLDSAEPQIARTFLTAISGLQDSLDMAQFEQLLAAGDYQALAAMLEDVARNLGSQSAIVFVNAGQSATGYLNQNLFLNIAFDQINVAAVQAMQANQLRLIREFTDGQRDVVREVVTHGIEQGLGPVDQARNFRQVVGLTSQQARAVFNYRRALEQVGRPGVSARAQAESLTRALRDRRGDAQVRRAIREARPLPPEKIDWMVQRYTERSIKHRAEVIARTEALSAVHEGDAAAFQQAVDGGKLDPRLIEETWVSAGDSRVRDSHRHLNGQKQPYGQLWQGLYGVLRYPGDPAAPAAERIQCRCIVTRRIRRVPMIGHNSAGANLLI